MEDAWFLDKTRVLYDTVNKMRIRASVGSDLSETIEFLCNSISVSMDSKESLRLMFSYISKYTLFWPASSTSKFTKQIQDIRVKAEVTRYLTEYNPMDLFIFLLGAVDEYVRTLGFVYLGTFSPWIEVKTKEGLGFHAVDTNTLGDRLLGTNIINTTLSYLKAMNLVFLGKPYDNGVKKFWIVRPRQRNRDPLLDSGYKQDEHNFVERSGAVLQVCYIYNETKRSIVLDFNYTEIMRFKNIMMKDHSRFLTDLRTNNYSSFKTVAILSIINRLEAERLAIFRKGIPNNLALCFLLLIIIIF